MRQPLLLAKSAGSELFLLPALANRHGLITGATGTGKTVTMQRLAEGFSAIGVPVFLADVKGDLAGLARAGEAKPKIVERLRSLGLHDFEPRANPTAFWDVLGEAGHPLRATISDMGPLLLARLLNLNATQTGVLQLAFKFADDNGLLLLDLKDLRELLRYVSDHARELKTNYGNISSASVGAIARGLSALEQQGGERFFGEPMLDIDDLLQTDASGRGIINILAADKLSLSPLLYGSFLLWLLAELYERLPEVGDLEAPKLVLFFDEAHLLFDSLPAALLEKIEQVIRLIRSKAVGVYFVTQNPADVPESVLGQLGNRVQHALRAFTPKDQKAVRVAADTLPTNPALDVRKAITELAVGEALVSLLDSEGRPSVTERAFIVPPASRLGPVSVEERRAVIASSLVAGHYEQILDRESAYERLRGAPAPQGGAAAPPMSPGAGRAAPTSAQAPAEASSLSDTISGFFFGSVGPRGGQHDGLAQIAAKNVVRSVSSSLGRELARGMLGSLLGNKRSR